MVTISDSTLRHNVWETIYDLVNAGVYSTSTAPTITAAFIDGDHSPFPQIVVEPVEVSKSDYMLGSDRTSNTKTISINIIIYTKKNQDLDLLADKVDAIVNTNITGLTLIDTSEVVGQLFPNEQKLRVKTLSYTFIRR